MPKINLTDLSNLQNEVTATSAINNNNTIIEGAIENSISRDGTQPNQMNSVLDMNSNKIINLPDAISDQEPVSYAQFVEGITSVNNGVVIDGEFVTLSHNPTMLAERVLIAGSSLEITDGGPKGDVSIGVSSAELNALATTGSAADKLPYYNGVGSAAITDFTAYARTILDDADAAAARSTLGVTLGTDVQPHSDLLDSLNASGTGVVAKTTASTITPRTVTGTANEISVSNGDGVLGNPTISLPAALTFTGKTVTGGSFSSPGITTPTGIVKGDVGLGNVDNTSDLNKPISTATQTALDAKVTGPASAVSANVATFNGTTGKLIQDSSKALPSGVVVGTTDIQTLTNKTIAGGSNTITGLANASLASAADSTIKSNISGSSASPSDNTITAVLDKQLGTTQGTVAYRGTSTWDALTPGTSGYFLKTQGAAANPTWAAIPGGGDLISTNNLSDLTNVSTARDNISAFGAVKKQIFTASGTYTPSSNMKYVIIECVGGGGGGGSVWGQTNFYGAGHGGGSGGYSRTIASAATIGASQTVTIGAGAAGLSGGSSGAPGTAASGGDTSVGTLCIAKGGSGGAGVSVSVSGSPGLGGVSGTGDFTAAGSPGGGGAYYNSGSVGTIVFSGAGGSSVFGGGAVVRNGAGSTVTGLAATSYGGGGGGASTNSNASSAVGGAGYAGFAIITEFCSS